MNETLQVFITIGVIGWLAIAAARLARKSHEQKKRYESASESERLVLEARMKKDPEFAAHMRAVSWKNTLLGFAILLVLLALKLTGVI